MLRAAMRLLLARFALRSVLLLAALAVSPPRTAHAAKPKAAESPTVAEARRHFEVGLAMLKESNFGAALGEFRESYALAQRPNALRNVAKCQRELHHFAAAFSSLEALLAAHGSELKPPDRLAIQRALEELRQLTAVVDVRVTPPGAEVTVDGAKVGTTPLDRLRVDSGSRRVRIAKTGYEPLEKTLEIVSMKDTTITGELTLEVQAGRLVVREATGLPVTIFLDGKSVGSAPYEGDVAPGSHTLEARGDRVMAKPRTIDVQKRARLEVALETVALTGKLRLRATPADAALRIDGGPASLGTFDGELPVGRHAVTVDAPGYARVDRLFDVVAGEALVQDIVLAAIPRPAEAAPVAPTPVPQEPVYEGFYSQLTLHYAHGLTPFAGAPCPKDANTYQCLSGDAMGGGTALRLGYSVGVVGFEAVGLGEIDYRTDKRETIKVVDESKLVESPNVSRGFLTVRGFVGGGLRILTPGHVRFTLGASPGYSMQSYSLTNTYANGSTFRTQAKGSNLAMLLDAGFLIGSSPGTKVALGVTAYADFVGESIYTPTGSYVDSTRAPRDEPAYQVAPSMNWTIMPTFGFQFGH